MKPTFLKYFFFSILLLLIFHGTGKGEVFSGFGRDVVKVMVANNHVKTLPAHNLDLVDLQTVRSIAIQTEALPPDKMVEMIKAYSIGDPAKVDFVRDMNRIQGFYVKAAIDARSAGKMDDVAAFYAALEKVRKYRKLQPLKVHIDAVSDLWQDANKLDLFISDLAANQNLLDFFLNAADDATRLKYAGAWEKLFHPNIPQAVGTNTTYLSAASKQIENYGSQITFQFERVLPHVPSNKLDDFFASVDNPKSIDHVKSLAGDFENISGINLSSYVPNGLPDIDIPAPGTWADPLLALPGDKATTFTNATAKTLSENQKIYRVLGEDQSSLGGFWTYELPTNKAELFGSTAVRPEWNAATHYVEYTIPSGGLKVWDGSTASQRVLDGVDEVNLPGGGTQIFIPEPYRQVGSGFENLPKIPISLW